MAVQIEVFSQFSSVNAVKCWDSTSIKPQTFPSKSTPIHQSSYHPTLYSLDAENVIKYLIKRKR
jgi:hypothetical protein